MAKIPLTKEEEDLSSYIANKWISIISAGAFLCLGVWMLISPAKPKHAYIEKATVSLLKDLWGVPFGLIILAISLPFIIYALYRIAKLRNLVWMRLKDGYYLFEGGLRISGLNSIRDKKHLLVFYPEKQKVLQLSNYYGGKYMRYEEAKEVKDLNNEQIYWSAYDNSYTIIHHGKNLSNSTYEFRGNDLVVSADGLGYKLLLKEYKLLQDGELRLAQKL
ncbi:MAG: hypothetical protein KDC82_02610 [Bacteroidetes bacterium]|nr:hypothetical protein [Bacteroidota bacterium]